MAGHTVSTCKRGSLLCRCSDDVTAGDESLREPLVRARWILADSPHACVRAVAVSEMLYCRHGYFWTERASTARPKLLCPRPGAHCDCWLRQALIATARLQQPLFYIGDAAAGNKMDEARFGVF